MSDDPPVRGEASELEELRARLADAEELLRAIQHGEVDALVISEESGERVYTLKSADAPYRALVEQMQEGAVTVSRGGDVMYSNDRFARLLGVPLERVIGASINQFVEEADRSLLMGMIDAGTGSLRTRLKTRNKPPMEANISVSSVVIDGMHHRTLIVTDMSTLTKVQRESRSKDEFLAMLAHELRNPLGAIGGAAQVLALAQMPDVHATHAREVIQRQTAHMARLVDDLLDVGRVVTGQIGLDLQPFDLAEFARSYVETITAGRPFGSQVEMSAESVWVSADPVRMEQILGNLVSNALKFAPPDRPVRVTVFARDGEAVLQVSDEGAGIDPELLPQVFDLFVQGPASVDRARGGLGIGLTLVRRLVELHGGSIEAFSAGRDQGATFTVRLPEIEPVEGGRAAEAPVNGRRLKVLLVDDNIDSREMYSLILEAAGHEVRSAGDGASALSEFRSSPPDTAIVDIGLPGIDGYEVARRMRLEPGGRDVTLIALTGYGFPEDRERSRRAGFDRHLVKPVAPEDLRQELAKIGQGRPH